MFVQDESSRRTGESLNRLQVAPGTIFQVDGDGDGVNPRQGEGLASFNVVVGVSEAWLGDSQSSEDSPGEGADERLHDFRLSSERECERSCRVGS